jgi:hypothetical protein
LFPCSRHLSKIYPSFLNCIFPSLLSICLIPRSLTWFSPLFPSFILCFYILLSYSSILLPPTSILEPFTLYFQVFIPDTSVGAPMYKLFLVVISPKAVCARHPRCSETRLAGEAKMSSISTGPKEDLPKNESGSKQSMQLLPP